MMTLEREANWANCDDGVHSGDGWGKKGDGNTGTDDILPTVPPTTTLAPAAVATVSKPPTIGTTTVEPTGPADVPTSSPASSLTPEEIACNFLSIPSLADCRATVSVDLSYDANGSTIPSEIGVLTQLTHLNLGYNNLTGTIPSSLSSLTQLRYLDFSFNELSGTIPSSLSSLTQLGSLVLVFNRLTGTFPSFLSTLWNLMWLDLSNNDLSGSIPEDLCLNSFPYVDVDYEIVQYISIAIDCGEIIQCSCRSCA